MLELLSPAGSPEAVVAAVQNGADAVYMGLGIFNARRGAKNFSDEEFEKAVRYCRIRDCKVYVTMNTLVGDREMEQAVELARRVSDLGADAILVQDLGLLSVLKKAVPDIPLHASTQMSIHNLAGVEAAAEMGLTRAVLARELSFEQIKFITKHSPIETEIFVHGALCFCHSGQCYMSSLIGRRSGNRGMCAQPCRMEYTMGGRLEDMDSIQFLPKIRGLARKPLVLLRDDGRNEKSAVESLSQEDACYLIRQATLEDMLQELRVPAHRPAESLEKRCERIYRSWGLSTYDANKRYLTGALRMMMGSDHRLAIRKEILGPVAEEYNLTVAAVDSALRRLLETLDETGTQTWRDFRKEYGLERRKVTIGRLLYALESKLSQQ